MPTKRRGGMIIRLVDVVLIVLFGFLATAVAGLVTSWIDRKVTARVQMRVGPPFFQPFYDIAKYMIKETTVPAGAPVWVFLAAPLIGLAAVSAAATILWRAVLTPGQTFVGDLIVLIYLLTMPALAVILGSFASRGIHERGTAVPWPHQSEGGDPPTRGPVSRAHSPWDGLSMPIGIGVCREICELLSTHSSPTSSTKRANSDFPMKRTLPTRECSMGPDDQGPKPYPNSTS